MRNLRAEALRIYFKTLDKISISRIIHERLRREGSLLLVGDDQIDLDQFEEVVLAGLGKSSLQMAAAVDALLTDKISRGVLVTDRRSKTWSPQRVRVLVGGHPVPNAGSIEGARCLLETVGSVTDRRLLIFLISGGGSSLAEMPISDAISLGELQALNRLLVQSGATIHEINTVRKFLSKTKGGRLGYLARDTRTVGLYLSDVNAGDLRTIASNPLMPETLVREDLERVLDRYGITQHLPPNIQRLLASPPGVPPDDWQFTKGLTTLLIGDNTTTLRAAGEVARSRGFVVEICDDLIEQSYQVIAQEMVNRLETLREKHRGDSVCLISGGEAACAVRGGGVGGRNQEFVLYSAASLKQSGFDSSAVVFSAGTDGVDGNSTAVGAAITFQAARRALQKNCDPSVFIDNSDSHSFFSEAGGLVVTGPTGNNVRDIRMMLAC